MIEVTVRVPIPEEFNLGKEIKIEQYMPINKSGGRILLRIWEKDEKKIKEVLASPNVMKLDVSQGFASIVLNRCAICKILEGTFLLEAKKENEQTMVWKLLVTESFSMDKLKKLNVEIVSIKKLSESAELTEKEERVLKIAYDMGYFEVPKKTGVRKIAKDLGKSPSTINEIIRRAEKKIMKRWNER